MNIPWRHVGGCGDLAWYTTRPLQPAAEFRKGAVLHLDGTPMDPDKVMHCGSCGALAARIGDFQPGGQDAKP